jgi:DNA-binding CsgD family transcriptional regulator
MPEEKRIIIGCDNSLNLSAVLNSMNGVTQFLHNIITTTRAVDTMDLAISMNPDIIILCFQNNQLILNEFNFSRNTPAVPVLCLTHKWENESLQWAKNNIVFCFPLEHIHNTEYLQSRINSIFLLRTNYSAVAARNVTAATMVKDDPVTGRNLGRYVLELDQKVEVLLKIKDRIAGLFPKVDDPTRTELMSIVNSIKMSANNKELWEDFKLFFEETDPHFLLALAKKYPFLTAIDMKYCCYLKMNMTNDDIKNIFGISLESVRTHKYRLKKKMGLPKEENLRNHLRAV